MPPDVLAELYCPIKSELQALSGEGDLTAERIRKWFSRVGQSTCMEGYFSENDFSKLVEMTKESMLSKL